MVVTRVTVGVTGIDWAQHTHIPHTVLHHTHHGSYSNCRKQTNVLTVGIETNSHAYI